MGELTFSNNNSSSPSGSSVIGLAGDWDSLVPVTMTSDVDDWVIDAGNPVGIVPGYRITVDAGGNYDINGIAAPASGQTTSIILVNVNSNGLNKKFKLRHEELTSVAANRLTTPNRSDFDTEEFAVVHLLWDSVSTRWFIINERKP